MNADNLQHEYEHNEERLNDIRAHAPQSYHLYSEYNTLLKRQQELEKVLYPTEAYPPAEATKVLTLDACAFIVGTLQQAALGANVRQTAVECLRLLGVGAEPDTGEEDTEILYPAQGE